MEKMVMVMTMVGVDYVETDSDDDLTGDENDGGKGDDD